MLLTNCYYCYYCFCYYTTTTTTTYYRLMAKPDGAYMQLVTMQGDHNAKQGARITSK